MRVSRVARHGLFTLHSLRAHFSFPFRVSAVFFSVTLLRQHDITLDRETTTITTSTTSTTSTTTAGGGGTQLSALISCPMSMSAAKYGGNFLGNFIDGMS